MHFQKYFKQNLVYKDLKKESFLHHINPARVDTLSNSVKNKHC